MNNRAKQLEWVEIAIEAALENSTRVAFAQNKAKAYAARAQAEEEATYSQAWNVAAIWTKKAPYAPQVDFRLVDTTRIMDAYRAMVRANNRI